MITYMMINDEANEWWSKLFDSLKNRYQNDLESIKGSEFVFDYIHLLFYKCHKIIQNRGGSYIYILLIGWKTKKQQ